MAIQKTEAIVIKTIPFRSSSLIVTFFSEGFGKLRGIAKGVRQERETRCADFELFTRLDIVFYEKLRSDLHLISETAVVETYDAVRTRLESISYASYIAELVDELSEVHDPHREVFNLLDFSLRYLPSLPGRRIARLFEIKLLAEIGWLPYLDRCLQCEKVLEQGHFSARQGGLFCEACRNIYPDTRPVGRDTLSAMRYYLHHDAGDSLKFPLSRQTETELEAFMNRFLTERLHKPLKSRYFLDKIIPHL